MTLPASTRRSPVYVGNGVATQFPFEFEVFEATDLLVVRTNADGTIDNLVLNSDYSVSLNSNQDDNPGGTITFPISGSPLASPASLVILGDLPYDQTLALPAGGNFPPTAIERAFDRASMQIQQINDKADASLRAPVGETMSALPPAASRALRTLLFDSNGDPTIAVPNPGSAAAVLADLADGVDVNKGATLLTTKLPVADAVARSQRQKNSDIFSVKDFGAVGDGVTDDTAAIQKAATRAMEARGTLYFPPNIAGASYKVTAPIVFTSAVHLRGAGVQGVTIFATGLPAGARIFDFDCLAANVVEHVHVEGMTLRSNNGSPNAMRVKNVAFVSTKNVRFYNVTDGLEIEGTRCFTHSHQGLDTVSVGGSTVKWVAGFTGGGQFVFDGCTLSGNIGVLVPSTAMLDNLKFSGCNFEQCGTNSLVVNGTIAGLAVEGCRTEGCNGIDFVVRPTLSSEYVGGFAVVGTVFGASDNSAASRIRIGGDAGPVRGFTIVGNVVTHGTDSFSGALVDLNGDGESGLVAGNYLRGTTCVAVNTQRAGVVVYANERLNGKLPEWWGTAKWGVSSSSFTATATGMTTSPTGTVKYTITGGVVTLDLPAISGTSNATTLTLTGAPTSIAPAADKDMLCRVQDNGSVTVGMLRVKTTGVLEFYVNAGANAFTASGTKGTAAMSVTYTLN